MALERTYTIPLRREWLKAPRYKRAKRAIAAVRTFLERHMKSEDIRIGTHLNLEIWKDIQNQFFQAATGHGSKKNKDKTNT